MVEYQQRQARGEEWEDDKDEVNRLRSVLKKCVKAHMKCTRKLEAGGSLRMMKFKNANKGNPNARPDFTERTLKEIPPDLVRLMEEIEEEERKKAAKRLVANSSPEVPTAQQHGGESTLLGPKLAPMLGHPPPPPQNAQRPVLEPTINLIYPTQADPQQINPVPSIPQLQLAPQQYYVPGASASGGFRPPTQRHRQTYGVDVAGTYGSRPPQQPRARAS